MTRFDDWLTTEPPDGPECEVWHDRTARKEWKCTDCQTPILPGAQYREVRQLVDGGWYVYRLCGGGCVWLDGGDS